MSFVTLKLGAAAAVLARGLGPATPLPRRTRSTSRSSPTGPAPSPAPAFRSPTACTTICEMLNQRDGGIGGVKLVIEECETGYDTKKGVECYEGDEGQEPGRGESVVDRHHAAAHPEGRRRQDPDPVHGLRPFAPRPAATSSRGCSTRRSPIGTALSVLHQVHRREGGRARQAQGQEDRLPPSRRAASARSRSRCSRRLRRISASS